MFYYSDDDSLSQGTDRLLLPILREEQDVFRTHLKYNIIFYFDIRHFLTSNIIDNETAGVLNQFGDVILDMEYDVIRILLREPGAENLRYRLVSAVHLFNIQKGCKKGASSSSVLMYNALYIKALCHGASKGLYRQHLYTSDCIRSLAVSAPDSVSIIRYIRNDEQILSAALRQLRTEKGWGRYNRLLVYDYSDISFEAAFRDVYETDLDTYLMDWYRLRVEWASSDSRQIEAAHLMSEQNDGAEKTTQRQLGRQDLFRFNGVLTPFYSIMSKNDRNRMLVPYNKIYRLYTKSDSAWTASDHINISDAVHDFLFFRDQLLYVNHFAPVKNSLKLYDIRSGHTFDCEWPESIKNTGQIIDYEAYVRPDHIDMRVLADSQGTVVIFNYSLIREGRRYKRAEQQFFRTQLSSSASANSLLRLQADSFSLVHRGIYHVDTLSAGPVLPGNGLCPACEKESTLSYFTGIKIADSIAQLVRTLREEEMKNDSRNIFSKQRYRTSPPADSHELSRLRPYSLRVVHARTDLGLSATDMIEYYPVFEHNGEFNYVMPGGLVQQEFSDLYRNHSVRMSFKLPLNLEGSDFLLHYINRKERLNWQVGMSRHVRYLSISHENTWLDSLFTPIPNQRKLIIYNLEAALNYPLKYFWNIGFESDVRHFRTVFSSIDPYSLQYHDTASVWNHNHLFISKTNQLNRGNHTYHLQIGFNLFTYNWQGMSPDHIMNAYFRFSSSHRFSLLNSLTTGLQAYVPLSQQKVLYNAGGAEGSVFPLSDSGAVFLQDSEYSLVKYVRPYRGSGVDAIMMDAFLLYNFNYYFGAGRLLSDMAGGWLSKGLSPMLQGFDIGVYSDNLLYKEHSGGDWSYGFSIGPLIRMAVNDRFKAEYSYHIPLDGRQGVWYISVGGQFGL